MLEMHYTGTLEEGKKLDSTRDRSEPFKFQIGAGQVIKGWEEDVMGMCVGEQCRLIVPAALIILYIIPGNATLYFDVELMAIEDPIWVPPVNLFKQMDLDDDKALTIDEISSYLKQQVETMQAAGGEQGEEARKILEYQDKLVEEIFADEDKDKDGVISHEEFSGPKHDVLKVNLPP